MVVGIPERFAIEFKVTKVVGHWIFGHFNYVVENKVLGVASVEFDLNSAVGAMQDLLRFKGLRGDPGLAALSPTEAFRMINRSLYIDYGQSAEQIASDKERFWRFHAYHPGFEAFDTFKCFLIESSDRARLLWEQQLPGSEGPQINETLLSLSEFDEVLLQFVNQMKIAFPAIVGKSDIS